MVQARRAAGRAQATRGARRRSGSTHRYHGRMPSPAEERMRDLLRVAPLIDGHNDLLWELRERRLKGGPDWTMPDLTLERPEFQTDLVRLEAGGVRGQFWSVYVPSDLPGHEAVTATLEQIDALLDLVRRYPSRMELARTAADVERIAASGRVASMIGVEGGQSIGCSLGTLRILAGFGAGLPHADPQRRQPVGGFRDRHRAPRRPHALRRGGGPRAEPLGHVGRPESHVARHDASVPRGERGPGDLLPLVGARPLRRHAERPRRRARGRGPTRRGRDGDVRALVPHGGGRRGERRRVAGGRAPARRASG